jgi:hypothetical protein
MHKQINRAISHSFRHLLFSTLFIGILFPQNKTNLEIFYSLTDSSVAQFVFFSKPPAKIKVEMNNGDVYSIFNNQLLGNLKAKGIDPVFEKNDSIPVFSYTIEKPLTQYTHIFRDGFLGPFLVNREISLKGNYFYSGSGKKEFSFIYTDTVKVDDIKNLENISFKFTNGTLPPEPFFTGIFEPVVALGTAAAAVILFFTVRSR